MKVIVLPPEQGEYISHALYPKTFTAEECEKIIRFQGEFKPATIYTDDQRANYRNPEIRSHLLKPLICSEETAWMFERMKQITLDANKNHFDFNISAILESQVLQYDPGDFFTIHSDIGNGLASTRKITLVTLLSDKSEFEGGAVSWIPAFPPFNFSQGDTIVFPAYILHGIARITSGRRFTLETIVHGPPFR